MSVNTGPFFVGIDVGSTYTKGAMVDASGKLVATEMRMTGVRLSEAAQMTYETLLRKAGTDSTSVAYIVGTGYGRYNIRFGNTQVTEIACHAKGAHYLFPNTRTVLDMGGQDTKAIRINERGEVVDFVMNDKCAAGTGRFVEGAAKALGLSLNEVGELSLKSSKPVKVSSTCGVFAESEVLEHLAWGRKIEDILYGVHTAIATRSIGLLRRVGIEPELTFTGGLSLNIGMRKALEEQLGTKLNASNMTVFCGAIGAALFALEKAKIEGFVENLGVTVK
ncbi:2-hydroxyisocaproyl-CoA dehydratase activator [archaeon HR03]|nr:2-hydroxyisocaproyl-CoA dehydratase activator [archaeon HR03]